jgi:hypothetical protein
MRLRWSEVKAIQDNDFLWIHWLKNAVSAINGQSIGGKEKERWQSKSYVVEARRSEP